MEERNDEMMELVEVDDNTECDDCEICEYSDGSDDSELDLKKVLMWLGLGAAAIGGIAFANKKRIKEALHKRKERKMRKYAEDLGYDIVDPDDYIEAECSVNDVDDTCESGEEE